MRKAVLSVVLGACAVFWQLACQHTKPVAETRIEKTAPAAVTAPQTELLKYSGDIAAINHSTETVTVKLLLAKREFEVATDCEIVTADKPQAALEDLKVGEAVDVLYQEQEGKAVAHRIALKGVTPNEKEADREKEHIEKILTQNPSERPAE